MIGRRGPYNGRMKRIAWFAVWIACLALTTSAVAGPEPEEKEEAKGCIQDLAWLAGTWKGKVGPGVWEAVYTTPSGDEVLSTNKEIRQGRVVSFEFERFFKAGEKIVMTPYVKGVKSVSFTMTTCDAKERKAIFENPKHDFPQRIEYHRAEEERLVITVSARRDGKQRGFRLDLQRAKSP